MQVNTEPVGTFLLEYAGRLGDIELDLTAEEIIGIEPPQNGVAIGDGGSLTTPVETHRTGIGAGTLRSETHLGGQRVDLQDHSGAGSDRVEMQGRDVELEAVHDRLMLDPRLAAGDHPHVEARPAHVRADERVIADELADIGGAENSTDRPGDHRLVQPWVIDRGQAAEGEERLDTVAEAVTTRDVLDARELLAAA